MWQLERHSLDINGVIFIIPPPRWKVFYFISLAVISKSLKHKLIIWIFWSFHFHSARPESSLSPCADTTGNFHLKVKKWPSPVTESDVSLILDFSTSETVRNKGPLYIGHQSKALCYSSLHGLRQVLTGKFFTPSLSCFQLYNSLQLSRAYTFLSLFLRTHIRSYAS